MISKRREYNRRSVFFTLLSRLALHDSIRHTALHNTNFNSRSTAGFQLLLSWMITCCRKDGKTLDFEIPTECQIQRETSYIPILRMKSRETVVEKKLTTVEHFSTFLFLPELTLLTVQHFSRFLFLAEFNLLTVEYFSRFLFLSELNLLTVENF